MPFCTKCGAELKASGRFCPKCGAPVSASAGAAPVHPTGRSGAKIACLGASPLLRTALLSALVVALAFGLFRLAAAPRQNTPEGTLTLLLDALAAGDTDGSLRCLDLSVQAQANARSTLSANGSAVLLNLFNAYAEQGGSLFRLEKGISSVRVLASRFQYTDYNGNACALDALVRVTTPVGEFDLALSGVPSVKRNGTWLIVT